MDVYIKTIRPVVMGTNDKFFSLENITGVVREENVISLIYLDGSKERLIEYSTPDMAKKAMYHAHLLSSYISGETNFLSESDLEKRSAPEYEVNFICSKKNLMCLENGKSRTVFKVGSICRSRTKPIDKEDIPELFNGDLTSLVG